MKVMRGLGRGFRRKWDGRGVRSGGKGWMGVWNRGGKDVCVGDERRGGEGVHNIWV